MAKESSKSAAPRKWDQVLTKVRGMLDATLAKVNGRIEELDNLANAKANDRLARHLEGLDQRLLRASTVVEQTDAALADGEKTVRDYMSSVEGLRKKLVEWAEQRSCPPPP